MCFVNLKLSEKIVQMKGMWINWFGGNSRQFLPELVSLFQSSGTIKCNHQVSLLFSLLLAISLRL